MTLVTIRKVHTDACQKGATCHMRGATEGRPASHRDLFWHPLAREANGLMNASIAMPILHRIFAERRLGETPRHQADPDLSKFIQTAIRIRLDLLSDINA